MRFCELLVERGANVELQDTWYNGRPLAWAAFGGSFKVCKMLVDRYNVDVTATNVHGQVASELVGDPTALVWKDVFIKVFPELTVV